MAAALGTAGIKPNAVSDEERRWMVVGVCLNKVLTPALRDVLANEIPKWHHVLLQPPCEIDKQTFGKHEKKLPPSTLNLNYNSINNNNAHKSPRRYDYAVKDPLSLAKLFMKPFMANFTGFDQSMDASAILSVMCEAKPFNASGADVIAKNVRSDIRNEWAHCNFSHWTELKFQAALQFMVSLIKKCNLTPVKEKELLDELHSWEYKGFQLCFGQPVDHVLLKLIKSEVVGLKESVKLWKENIEFDQIKLLKNLERLQGSLEQEVQDLKDRQARTEKDVDLLKRKQLCLHESYITTREDVERVKMEVAKISNPNGDTPYFFQAPKQTRWFSGRESELRQLRGVLEKEERKSKEKVILAAVSGLGGSGKSSLVAEYAQRRKDYYKGGVIWFSGEDDKILEVSVNDIAVCFGTFQDNSFDATLSKTLAAISRIQEPWLLVLDDMDELNLSQSLLKLVSGPWQQGVTAFGHLIITTRRKQSALTKDIRCFEESCYLKLECFGPEEAKIFVFRRTGITSDETTGPVADILVQKLGGLPLALEQACAYIRCLKCTISSYLEEYTKQSLQLLNEQKASPVSVYKSPEGLAVRTTWLLNFQHIRKNVNGAVAIRFLNACAFLNPNEIQLELINVGEPLVEDGAYRDYVSTLLGSRQVLKFLTDFSLFKETQDSCLRVHRLVQEVIRENLNFEQKAESFIDAVRLLRFAFTKCPSPDDLLTSVVNKREDRSSIRSNDPSFFHKWHKLCLHSYELRKNLKMFLDTSCGVSIKEVFLPETARIVYECALHLNVNGNSSEAKTVADFAYRILDWGGKVVLGEKLKALFPHMVPLPEPVRRYIQYSCHAPFTTSRPSDAEKIEDDTITSEQLETIRLTGNSLFKECRFVEAIELYSSVIKMSKGTKPFDPRLLSNRASAYLKLKQYDNALKDAEDYIMQCPNCWKGYARQALAFDGLDDKLNAKCSAALAFYRDQNIFRQFLPFKAVFPGLQRCISVCDNVSSLCALLPLQWANMDKIIVLEPGEYQLSDEYLRSFKINKRISGDGDRLVVAGCILLGVENSVVNSRVTLSFLGNLGVFSQSCMAVNISFVFDKGNWFSAPGSTVKVSNCSFTSNVDDFQPAFFSSGNLNVKNCSFKDCKGTGLCVDGNAEVEDSIFSGNVFGVKVCQRGRFVVTNSKLHGNSKLGLHIGPYAGKCAVFDCQIYDNKLQGIGLSFSTHVRLVRNRIFHNDRHGIFIDNQSFAVIEQNEIFENCWYGISTLSDSWCRVSNNKIYRNKCGGVHVVPIAPEPEGRESIVEFNKIFGNGGPGIDETVSYSDTEDKVGDFFKSSLLKCKELRKAKCTGNELKDNEEEGSPAASKDMVHICFSCCKKSSTLKKCSKCFTAGYCNHDCQKKHWKEHKSSCHLLLQKSSVLLNVVPIAKNVANDKCICMTFHIQGPRLQPVGPDYADAPQRGKRFIVKIQACDSIRRKSAGDSPLLSVRDRSLAINNGLDLVAYPRIYALVRQCGFNCQSYGWKKMFMWALINDNSEAFRVFINEFPPFQPW